MSAARDRLHERLEDVTDEMLDDPPPRADEHDGHTMAHDEAEDSIPSRLSLTSKVRKLLRIDFADIRPQLGGGYVVKGLITHGTLVALLGASGSGKSFYVIDIGLHVASGRSWRGHRVRKGLVVYFSLEGAASAQNRIVAWCSKNAEAASLPFCICPGPINLRDNLDIAAVLQFVQEAEAVYGEPCVLVIIDTLSRAMAGGKENHPEDMTALIGGADAIKEATGAAVVLVHHFGKDESRGGRGHSSLKGALDTEIEICRNGDERTATVSKQRDGTEGARYAFKLETMTLGLDEEGDSVTSCVAVGIDAKAPKRPEPRGTNQTAILAAVQEWQRGHPTIGVISDREMREIFKVQNVKLKRMPEVTAGLVKFGWLETVSGGYRVIPEATP